MIKKNIPYILVFSYVAACYIILRFDIGETLVGGGISNLFISFIPSISAISNMTEGGKSSALILSLSWVFSILLWLIIGVKSGWAGLDMDLLTKKQPLSVYILIYFVALGLLAGAFFITPSVLDNEGMYARPVITGLMRYKYFMVWYGVAFLFFIFSIVNYLIGLPIFYFRKLIYKVSKNVR